LMYNCQLYINW